MGNNNTKLNDLLAEELNALGLRESSLEEQCRVSAEELEEVRRRRNLIRALLGLADDGEVATALESGDAVRALVEPKPHGRKARGVADIAYDIVVARRKKPIYYEELAEQVIEAGGILGGESPAQTLVARISRDPRFVRPEKRGWYAAREFYPKARSVGARAGTTRQPKHCPAQ